MVALATLLGLGGLQFWLSSPHALLSLYAAPVLFAAYRGGRRPGFVTAGCALVVMAPIAFLPLHATSRVEPVALGLELAAVASTLVAIAWLIGALREQSDERERSIVEARHGALAIVRRLVEAADPENEAHARRVADSSARLGKRLGISAAEIEELCAAAWLHDLEESDPTVALLRETAALAPEEITAREPGDESNTIPERSMGGILKRVISIVVHSRERWDGTGFHRIAAEEIPIGARILAVADTYDTMVSDRPYHKGRPDDDAIQTVRQESGQRFDPRVVAAFLELRATEPVSIDPARTATSQRDDQSQRAA
jgi:HD-GYP domain-containing protein (c-di-GMP phosphodiesterase class II)